MCFAAAVGMNSRKSGSAKVTSEEEDLMMIPVSLDEKRTAQQQMWEHATPYFESWDPCNTLSALIEQAGAQVTLECSKLTAEMPQNAASIPTETPTVPNNESGAANESALKESTGAAANESTGAAANESTAAAANESTGAAANESTRKDLVTFVLY